MKLLTILFLFLGVSNNQFDLAQMRTLYSSAVQDEKKALQLMAIAESHLYNSTVKGYYGGTKMLMAKHYSNPYSKLKSFNEGKDILESAIRSDPQNTELRFLRLGIQNNAPSFLGYSQNTEEDRLFIRSRLASIKDEQLKSIMSTYLKTN